MPYRLQAGEEVGVGLRRCAREQLDSAITQLTREVDDDPAAAIHGARKSLKKERSLLRLGRAALKPRERRRENAVFRAAGRRLSEARDAEVMLESLRQLQERYAGQVPRSAFEEIEEHLRTRRAGQLQTLIASPPSEEVAEELRAVRLRIESWEMRSDGWSALEPGLLRSYRRGRKAMRRARRRRNPEPLHEWRKRAKDLWYHLRVLRPMFGHSLKGHADDAHELSDQLGDDRDLAMLRQTLIELSPQLRGEYEAVLGLIEHRRNELQDGAFLLGERLYAERPKALRKRMRRYWKAWRAEQALAQARRPAELPQATRTPAQV